MIKRYKIPIYFGRLYVAKVKSYSELYKLANINPDIHDFQFDEFSDNNYGALMFEHPENAGRIYIAVNDKTTTPMIVHECVHAANSIFRSCGIKLDIDNDEPYAYLLGWIYEKVEQALK